nr:hypothetical protein [Tanacetum cinerariifolium]
MHELMLFYNGLGIPTRQILDSRGAIPSKTVADAKGLESVSIRRIQGFGYGVLEFLGRIGLVSFVVFEQAAKAQNWKLPVCYDDDDDEESSIYLEDNIISELPPCSAVTPSEPVDSLSMGDEHLDTIPATESDEFIKSSVKNLSPNPSESEGDNECDVPAGFTTFSNVLFDAEYDFDSSDDQSFSDEYLPEKIYSNPLFD